MEYKVYASLIEDSISGFIWTDDNSIPNGFVVVSNKSNNKKIRVYKRSIEKNYLDRYNDEHSKRYKITNGENKNIVISEFYRNILGISTQKVFDLEIKLQNPLCSFILRNFNHPNPYIGPNIVFATTIAFISFSLGMCSSYTTKKYRNELDKRMNIWEVFFVSEREKLNKSINDIDSLTLSTNQNYTLIYNNLEQLKNTSLESKNKEDSTLFFIENLIIQTNNTQKNMKVINKEVERMNRISKQLETQNAEMIRSFKD